jgi:hypothetical protein
MQSRRRSAETQRSFKAEAQLALGNRLTWAARRAFVSRVGSAAVIGRPHRFCGCRGYAGTLFADMDQASCVPIIIHWRRLLLERPSSLRLESRPDTRLRSGCSYWRQERSTASRIRCTVTIARHWPAVCLMELSRLSRKYCNLLELLQ